MQVRKFGKHIKTNNHKKAETRKACWSTMLQKAEYLSKFFSKLKNAEDTVISMMVKTSLKYLISLVVCVGYV